MTEKVLVKRFDTTLPMPEYKTGGAAGFDLYSREDYRIPAKSSQKVPLNVAIALPSGYWILLSARSSLYKKGLVLRNGVGIMDNDYRGDEDEYQAVLYNFSEEEVTVEKGERVTQAVIMPIINFHLEEVSSLGESRGGFGTTGVK